MKNETTPTDKFERALSYKVDGRYQEALNELREYLKERPDDAEGHHQLGLILGFNGDFDPSLAELKQAVDLAPENALIRNDLALTFTMLGMYDEAKDQFARVLAKDRENPTALRNLTYFE